MSIGHLPSFERLAEVDVAVFALSTVALTQAGAAKALGAFPPRTAFWCGADHWGYGNLRRSPAESRTWLTET